MLLNILTGFPIMALCLLLEALILAASLRYYRRHETWINDPSFPSTIFVISVVMMLLVVGNILQVGIWGSLFLLLGEFSDYPTAFYHSAVNFATLGYGDLVMSEKHRLLGPLEAINGVLMIGVSTSVLMTIFQDAAKRTVEARRKQTAE